MVTHRGERKTVKTGGIEWTLRDGIPFHAPTLAAEVRTLVANAKKEQKK